MAGGGLPGGGGGGTNIGGTTGFVAEDRIPISGASANYHTENK